MINVPKCASYGRYALPLQTYGKDVLNLVTALDPYPLVIDSDKAGRVDIVPMVWSVVKDFEAEAVCVISNPIPSKQVVFALEARGVAAFGPIFDS
ncbi:hypothetical protein AJ80_00172 [Polytolypa hystricis UAMH7299]|uniref:Uncharacterized protein n=1 Tax=Polytolypa hystricis (strain UAMH7299) TaxID=1447883 RepID=A0A2B7Z4I7_POLH7|nr:hypothetical protein AJ80_00172 [Polytolypa hystricis UAMH7299]